MVMKKFFKLMPIIGLSYVGALGAAASGEGSSEAIPSSPVAVPSITTGFALADELRRQGLTSEAREALMEKWSNAKITEVQALADLAAARSDLLAHPVLGAGSALLLKEYVDTSKRRAGWHQLRKQLDAIIAEAATKS